MFGWKKARLQDILAEEDHPEGASGSIHELGVEGADAASPISLAAEPRPALPSPSDREELTVVGRQVVMEGRLGFSGRACIEGVFRGKVDRGHHLEVGTGGLLEADVAVGTLVIRGQISGNVVAEDGVEIEVGGRMRGDIRTPALQVHRGAFFNGRCDMGDG